MKQREQLSKEIKGSNNAQLVDILERIDKQAKRIIKQSVHNTAQKIHHLKQRLRSELSFKKQHNI